MTDYIDRQAAIDALEWKWAGKAAFDAIKELPSIEVEPVKHGVGQMMIYMLIIIYFTCGDVQSVIKI